MHGECAPRSHVLYSVASLSGTCSWKGGRYFYYAVVLPGGKRVENACWRYPEVAAAAKHFENFTAFHAKQGIKIE
jgi:uncharacterized protein (DUF427 family)